MSTKTTAYRFTLLLFIVGVLFFAVFATKTTVLAIDYPCGTYGSGDYTSSPECNATTPTPLPSGTSSSPSSSPSTTGEGTSSPNPNVPSSGNSTQNVAANDTQANTQKDSSTIVPYIVAVIVVGTALVIGLLIRHGKANNL